MSTDFDIVICGAGPVGLTLALELVRRGMAPARIAIVDPKTPDQAVLDPRSIALSYGSRQILAEVGAWPVEATEIHQIHVSRRGHFGRTLIERGDYRLPALGYVSRYGMLVAALADAARKAGLNPVRGTRVATTTERDAQVDVQLSDGTALAAGFLARAEGGVFAEQDERTQRRDYGQTAIVAQVRAASPVAHRAYERFTEEGPLALLPQDEGYAMVWCVRPDTAERLMMLPDAAFLQELGEAFGARLGRFLAVSSRSAYALGLNARPATSARTVAIGNAAQTLHPVAGQGLNLGLRDAAVLSRLLARDLSPASLERFARERKHDRSLTIRLTDLMARIFSSAPDGAPTQSVLGLALGGIDVLPPARRLLAEQMMFGQR